MQIDVVGVRIDRALGQVPQLHVFGHALDIRVESFLIRRHQWLLSSVWCGEEKNEASSRSTIGDHDATRVRYPSVARVTASRGLFPAKDRQKEMAKKTWQGRNRTIS